MGSILALLSNGLGFLKNLFGYQEKKLELNNTDEMRQAAERSDEVKAQDKTDQAITSKNVDEIRKELAE